MLKIIIISMQTQIGAMVILGGIAYGIVFVIAHDSKCLIVVKHVKDNLECG